MNASLLSRWIKFLIQKDPSRKLDVLDLLREFGEREGYAVGELDATFREEFELAQEAERLKKLAERSKPGSRRLAVRG